MQRDIKKWACKQKGQGIVEYAGALLIGAVMITIVLTNLQDGVMGNVYNNFISTIANTYNNEIANIN